MTYFSFNYQKGFLMLTLNLYLQTLENWGFLYTTLYMSKIHIGVGAEGLWAIAPSPSLFNFLAKTDMIIL